MTLSESQLEKILGFYGHTFTRLLFVASGYRNTSHIVETDDGVTCNIIVYKNEGGIVERIRRVNGLSAYLHAKGLPVRTPLDERIVVMEGGQATRYASLYSFESGETIPWEAYTKNHIKLLGMALGRIHEAGETYSGQLPFITDEYFAIVGRMRKYFAQVSVQRALREKLGIELKGKWFHQFDVLLREVAVLPTRLPLHMDLVRSNVLFQQAQPKDVFVVNNLALSGVLDFEKTSYGHPLVDVARTLAFLLVDCNKPTTKIYKYLLDSGYQKRGGRQLSSVALSSGDMLEQLITLFLTYDFYKFVKQNPYESLPANRHFTRTAEQLTKSGVLIKTQS